MFVHQNSTPILLTLGIWEKTGRKCFFSLLSPVGIAVPRANLVEGADGSPIVKTIVTVYYCKDCGEERCKPFDYTDFEIIGKTEDEIFSNEKIQLVINKTHITMCFQQENMSHDGAYVIFWEKDEGLGEPCGILKSGGKLSWKSLWYTKNPWFWLIILG